MQYLANYYSDLITVDSILQSSNKTDGSLRLPIIPVCAAEFCRRQTMRPRHVPSPPFPTPFPNTLSQHIRTRRRKGEIITETAAGTKKCHRRIVPVGWHFSQEI